MTDKGRSSSPKVLPVIRSVICRCPNDNGWHGCDLTADAVLVALHAAGWTLNEPPTDDAVVRRLR